MRFCCVFAVKEALAGATGHLQGDGRLRPGPMQGVATRSDRSPAGTNDCCQPARGSRQRLGHKCILPTVRSQGATARGQATGGGCPLQGEPPARAAAGRSGRQHGQRPREATPPAREVLLEGSSAWRRGDCPRRWRAAPPPA
ncbi:hypothetical protein BHM03_00046693 [Ensete ventricosum]|nr:hypothetical protein BHM03_00046693 [Ensete ventricosum]